ncbi:Suf-domain-containing protein [Dothidotthia symphoricarpi CBS 119687]|uniref:mRNA 3'-end-processing protein RNA14 n=1 Tax=Dothidotthia symphoricarpi CBS 119687 TaxID=1392245 RepID=A0A6A6ADC2_9PLEO|nr:Suf-domain-containing protein [Dothidotthia symphoricarpi CBS 119687]KAF2129770.1 Suf-domain-containing protein [Dothidotthia symphoricarpi CBS 119687]
MADDAELAFLQGQTEYDPTATWSMTDAQEPAADDDDDDDEYDPTNTYSPHVSDQSASMPESAVNSPPPAENNGDQVSMPMHAVVSTEASAAPTPTLAKQPRTVGGFVVESEDEEEEPVAQPKTAGASLSSASSTAEAPQRSFTISPNNTLPTPDVQLHSAQDQGPASVFSASVAANEPSLSLASTVPNGSTPAPDAAVPGAPDFLNAASARQSAAPATPAPTSSSLPKPRLPQDRIGILEDRVAEDPRGDVEAWQNLIEEHRRRHKNDEARAVYERFFKVFPTAGEKWIEFIHFETELDELQKVEVLFARSVPLAPYVALYSAYIDFIRRRYNLTTDSNGTNRQIITQAYEFVLEQVGIDVSAGKLWLDYIEMLKTGPGVLGGSSWQDMQKMDTVRKVYQRAVSIPHGATLEIWREYDRFEMNLNKVTGRKNLQEKSPSYMTARSAINVLDNNITRDVDRTTIPKLPPANGFDGHEEYMKQVQVWKNWIQWEKSDPVECAADDRALYNKRVLHIYKNALIPLRFWPELWFDAAEWSFDNGLPDEGSKFLSEGIDANPESCLLAFRKAHQVELRNDFEDGQPGLVAKGKAVREPYMRVLDTLYDLTDQTKKRQEHSVARAREAFEAQKKADESARAIAERNSDDVDEENEAEATKRSKEKDDAFNAQVQAISAGYNAQMHILKKTLTYAWIALMRAMRRVQGQGTPGADVSGFRGVFKDARKKGKLLSEAYVVSALIEHHCYQDPAASKIFERGMRLFPEDTQFALEYIKHLIKLNDSTNARAVFETIVGKVIAKAENIAKAKPLFLFFHEYESQFGELAQITKIEQRMATLFPEDPQLHRFSQRFADPTFDPMTVRPVISPRTQMRPVMPAMPGMPGMPGMPNIMNSIEEQPLPAVPPQVQAQEQRHASPGLLNSPHLNNMLPVVNSPKRPLEDTDDNVQPRKLARGESPLKGAAGRRLDAARRNLAANGSTPVGPPQGPAPIAKEITFLLSIIPSAHTYRETRFKPEAMVNMLRNIASIPIPTLAGHQGLQPQRYGTTPTTAQQLLSIQEKYGNGGHPAPHNAWGP